MSVSESMTTTMQFERRVCEKAAEKRSPLEDDAWLSLKFGQIAGRCVKAEKDGLTIHGAAHLIPGAPFVSCQFQLCCPGSVIGELVQFVHNELLEVAVNRLLKERREGLSPKKKNLIVIGDQVTIVSGVGHEGEDRSSPQRQLPLREFSSAISGFGIGIKQPEPSRVISSSASARENERMIVKAG